MSRPDTQEMCLRHAKAEEFRSQLWKEDSQKSSEKLGHQLAPSGLGIDTHENLL